jgi:hypothetical protein
MASSASRRTGPAANRSGRAIASVAGAFLVATMAAACDHYAAAGAAPPSLTPAPAGAQAAPAFSARGCNVPSVASTAVIEPVRSADGCVAPTQALVYRCDPAFEPIAVFDLAGHPRRFIGGRYAVGLASLPAGAQPLGFTGLGRLYRVPDDPRALVVEAGDAIERWLALPAHGEVPGRPTVAIIGDSILDGASAALTARLSGWSLSIDGVIGRSSAGGIAPAEALGSPLPDAVVVELGVNDHDATSFRANAERILDAVAGARLVVWVTAHGPDPVADEVDADIDEVMGPLDNGSIADWNRAVSPDALSSDGIHLEDASGSVFAGFLAQFLETWRLAAAGGGADRCGRDVAAAVAG